MLPVKGRVLAVAALLGVCAGCANDAESLPLLRTPPPGGTLCPHVREATEGVIAFNRGATAEALTRLRAASSGLRSDARILARARDRVLIGTAVDLARSTGAIVEAVEVQDQRLFDAAFSAFVRALRRVPDSFCGTPGRYEFVVDEPPFPGDGTEQATAPLEILRIDPHGTALTGQEPVRTTSPRLARFFWDSGRLELLVPRRWRTFGVAWGLPGTGLLGTGIKSGEAMTLGPPTPQYMWALPNLFFGSAERLAEDLGIKGARRAAALDRLREWMGHFNWSGVCDHEATTSYAKPGSYMYGFMRKWTNCAGVGTTLIEVFAIGPPVHDPAVVVFQFSSRYPGDFARASRFLESFHLIH